MAVKQHPFLVLGAIALAITAGTGWAQTTTRRVATVPALRNHPAFYHGQAVFVRGELTDADTRPTLVSGDSSIRILTRESVPSAGSYDVRGEVLDIGRLSPDDPRLSSVDLRPFGIDAAERWPRQGDVVLLRVTSFEKAEPLRAPSIRALALDPWRYEDQRVTVRGQFRGRNLYGDVPQAPAAAAESKGEFVLRSADAAIWVLGKRPRGHGFALDPESRIDTKRWLEVSGVVHQARGPRLGGGRRDQRSGCREGAGRRGGGAAADAHSSGGALQRARRWRNGRPALDARAHPVLARHRSRLVQGPRADQLSRRRIGGTRRAAAAAHHGRSRVTTPAAACSTSASRRRFSASAP